MLKQWQDYIQEETRSTKLSYNDKPTGSIVKKWDIDGTPAEIGIKKQ
jgi:hypothetical protein